MPWDVLTEEHEAVGLGLARERESPFSTGYVSGDDDEATAGVQLAFQAADHDTVQRLYGAAVEAGGCDNGRPVDREHREG